MSLLSEQVEARIARAKRAFRQSGRIIDAAKDDLESHARWLERHRAAWTEEVKRNLRLLDRKLAVKAFARFAIGAILLLPLALARALLPGASPQPRLDQTALRFARRVEFELRIRGLDERQAKEGAPPPAPPQIEMPRGWAPPQARRAAFFALAATQARRAAFFALAAPQARRAASFTLAALARLSKHRVPVSALGLGTLLLIAAGAVGATLSSPSAEAPALAAQKSHAPPPHAAATSMMVRKSRQETGPISVRGFAVLPTAPSFEAPRVPARTVADLMAMTGPLPLAPMGLEAAAPLAEKPLATKQAAKAKPRRKLAVRAPQPLPWWQQWSWMRLR